MHAVSLVSIPHTAGNALDLNCEDDQWQKYVIEWKLNQSGGDLCLGLGGTGRWWTIGRVVAAGRPEARSAGGRPWGWVSGGVAPPVKGVRGITPEKFLNLQMQNPAFWRILTSKTIYCKRTSALERKKICCSAAALVLLSNWSQKLGG
jgi:hypothetical protein